MALELPSGPPRPAPDRYRIPALTGGGHRGLFTARVLEDPAGNGVDVRTCVDLYAGTPIGSILGGALALGVAPVRLRDMMLEHGSRIFPIARGVSGRQLASLRALWRAPYSSAPVERAIWGAARRQGSSRPVLRTPVDRVRMPDYAVRMIGTDIDRLVP